MADERTLRETKAELVEGLASMDRAVGKLPQVRKHEDLVDSVLEKVERSPEIQPKPSQPKKPSRRELHPGEWAGEAEHSPKIPEAVKGERVKVVSQEIGEYAYGYNGTDDLRPVNGSPGVKASGERPPEERVKQARDLMLSGAAGSVDVARDICQEYGISLPELIEDPKETKLRDWIRCVRQSRDEGCLHCKDLWLKLNATVGSNDNADTKAKVFQSLYADTVRVHGPMRPKGIRDPKIIVT